MRCQYGRTGTPEVPYTPPTLPLWCRNPGRPYPISILHSFRFTTLERIHFSPTVYTRFPGSPLKNVLSPHLTAIKSCEVLNR